MDSHLVISWMLTPLDWIVFLVVIALTLLAISYGHTRKKKSKNQRESFLELLLMGRSLTLPMFVATLVATWYGGIFGVTAIAFEQGLYNFIIQGVFWYITYIIFALWMLDKIKSRSASTLAEMVGEMFGPRSQRVAAIFNFFNVVPITYAISLGIFLQMIIGVSLPMGMLLGTLFVVTYSMFGGLRSVVYSDLVQFFVMCSGVFMVLAFSVGEFGGWSYLREHLPERYFTLSGGESLGTVLVWALIALSTLVDPNFYQRALAAKSTAVARKGIFISVFIWLLFDLSTTFGAMYAKTQIPHALPGQAYLNYSLQLLPEGFRGFFLAGILATILSTMDSYLFIAGTSLTYDLIPKKWQRVSLIPMGTVGVGALAVLIGTFFEGNIKDVWKTLGSYSAACLLAPVLFGHFFPKKISDNQFAASCLLGVVGTTYWRFYPLGGGGESSVDPLYVGTACTLSALAISLLVNRYRKKESAL